MNLNIFIITLIIFVNSLVCYAEDEKRILLSDPQYSHGIEASLQALTSRIDHLETQHITDIARIDSLESQHQANISRLNKQHLTDISRLESQQQINVSKLKESIAQCHGNVSKLEIAYQTNISRLENVMSQSALEMQAFDSSLKTLSSKIYSVESEKGGLYVRWGRTICPAINGTEMVYTGYTAGSLYTDHGGAANHLCMPKDPEFLPHQSGTRLYGTEYEQNFNGNNYNDDAPCSVCKAQRTSIMMLPGRQHCYSGWVVEYTGILVAGHSGHGSATEYICLDSAPESLDHGSGNDDQKLLYFVNSQCGSLPCPPYKNDGTLSCVVCSKR